MHLQLKMSQHRLQEVVAGKAETAHQLHLEDNNHPQLGIWNAFRPRGVIVTYRRDQTMLH